MTPCCIKCRCTVFNQTCLVTYEEVYEIAFDEEGGIDRTWRKDYEKYSEDDRSSYRCSKCGWVLADDQGTPLLKAEDIKRWVQSHEQDLEAAESGGNSDDS